MGKKKWMPKLKLKKGALSRQLGIPVEKNIPMRLLQKIKKAKIGSKVRNPTKTGKKVVRVTHLLKKRAVLAVTLKKARKVGRKKR